MGAASRGYLLDSSEGMVLDAAMDYRGLLNQAYQERFGRNPRYSLRSFARDLEIQISQLADVMKGQQGISPARAQKIAQKLNWGPEKSQRFCLLVQAEHGRAALQRERAKILLRKKHKKLASEDLLKVIGQWQHLAILELLGIENFDPTEKNLSHSLGLSNRRIKASLERLHRTGMINFTEGRWRASEPSDFSTTDDIPSTVIQNFHRQILQRSLQALELPPSEREFQSLIFTCSREDLPALKKKIRHFCEEFTNGTQPKKEVVFALSLQLTPLTKKEEK